MRFPIFQQKMYSSPSNEIFFLLLLGELLAQGWVGDATTSQPDRPASIIQEERKKKIDESIKSSPRLRCTLKKICQTHHHVPLDEDEDMNRFPPISILLLPKKFFSKFLCFS